LPSSGWFIEVSDSCVCWVICVFINAPGSWHDAKVAQDLFSVLIAMNGSGRVVSDSAFLGDTEDSKEDNPLTATAHYYEDKRPGKAPR